MDLTKGNKSTLSQRKPSRTSNNRQSRSMSSFSQPVASTSRKRIFSSQNFEVSSSKQKFSEEQNELVNSLIKYLLVLSGQKQVISKPHIIKNVFGNQGRVFSQIMNEAKTLLSSIFGFKLVELQGNKYILINEIENKLPHIYPNEKEGSEQVLLLLTLTHIFMCEEYCSEDSLWKFLANLGILSDDNVNHHYFGNVKHLVSDIFVAQRYLDKIAVDTNDSIKIEFKWGPRAEYEFSRRAALKFVSQIYSGRPINNWLLHYKIVLAKEKANTT